jgi:GNAT superfamily N-acetyltransferase
VLVLTLTFFFFITASHLSSSTARARPVPARAIARAALARAAALVALRNALLPEAVADGDILIDYLAVAPGARRQGVGSALLAWAAGDGAARAAAAAAPPPTSFYPSLILWVAADNEEALCLYAGAGFCVAGDTDRAGRVTRAAVAWLLGRPRCLRLVRALPQESGGGGGDGSVTPDSVLDAATVFG